MMRRPVARRQGGHNVPAYAYPEDTRRLPFSLFQCCTQCPAWEFLEKTRRLPPSSCRQYRAAPGMADYCENAENAPDVFILRWCRRSRYGRLSRRCAMRPKRGR